MIVAETKWKGRYLPFGAGSMSVAPPLFGRGLGSIDGSTPTTPASPCATQWAWSLPTCWQWPKSLIYGDSYSPVPMPVPVGSTLPDGSAIPAVPASGQTASDTIQAITNQQMLATQNQDLGFFSNLNDQLKEQSGVPWWGWLLGGLAVFGLVAGSSGSPRRYGR